MPNPETLHPSPADPRRRVLASLPRVGFLPLAEAGSGFRPGELGVALDGPLRPSPLPPAAVASLGKHQCSRGLCPCGGRWSSEGKGACHFSLPRWCLTALRASQQRHGSMRGLWSPSRPPQPRASPAAVLPPATKPSPFCGWRSHLRGRGVFPTVRTVAEVHSPSEQRNPAAIPSTRGHGTEHPAHRCQATRVSRTAGAGAVPSSVYRVTVTCVFPLLSRGAGLNAPLPGTDHLLFPAGLRGRWWVPHPEHRYLAVTPGASF